MALQTLLEIAILYFFIPLWMLAGFGDWIFHRITHISETAGTKESALHLLMIAELGLPTLAGLFMEINALVIATMIVGYLLHEATVLWDLRYTTGKRAILPGEQIMHSYQEVIPLTLLTLVALLHWDQFHALVTMNGRADFSPAWKREPLSPYYLATVLSATSLLVVLPFIEELWRCIRRAHQQPVMTEASRRAEIS